MEGVVTADHFFGVIHTLDEDDDALDERVWCKANPLLGVAVQLDELRGYAVEARNSPASMGEFKTKRLNIWTSLRSQQVYINIMLWRKCDGKVDLEALREVPCWAGVDLSAVSGYDGAAAGHGGSRVACLKLWGKYYLPEDTVTRPRSEKGNVPYQVWADQKLIDGYAGQRDGDSRLYIKNDIRWAQRTFNLRAVGYDPWNALQLATELLA